MEGGYIAGVRNFFMFCRKRERKVSAFLPKRAAQIDKKAK